MGERHLSNKEEVSLGAAREQGHRQRSLPAATRVAAVEMEEVRVQLSLH